MLLWALVYVVLMLELRAGLMLLALFCGLHFSAWEC